MLHNRYLAATLTAVLVIASGSVSYGAENQKTKSLEISYNNQKVDTDKAPFIVNGTTYVPLRLLAELFGKNVNFDSKNYIVEVSDKTNQTNGSNTTDTKTTGGDSTYQSLVTSLQQQITQNNQQIAQLSQKIADLQSSQQTEIQVPKLSMSDLKNVLNASNYLRIRFLELSNIGVFGDDKNITVLINTDLNANEGDNYQNLKDVTSDDLNSYVTSLGNKIRENFPNATITGTITNTVYNAYSTTPGPTMVQNIASFIISSDGKVSVTKKF